VNLVDHHHLACKSQQAHEDVLRLQGSHQRLVNRTHAIRSQETAFPVREPLPRHRLSRVGAIRFH
jgi:hypothetical protein